MIDWGCRCVVPYFPKWTVAATGDWVEDLESLLWWILCYLVSSPGVVAWSRCLESSGSWGSRDICVRDGLWGALVPLTVVRCKYDNLYPQQFAAICWQLFSQGSKELDWGHSPLRSLQIRLHLSASSCGWLTDSCFLISISCPLPFCFLDLSTAFRVWLVLILGVSMFFFSLPLKNGYCFMRRTKGAVFHCHCGLPSASERSKLPDEWWLEKEGRSPYLFIPCFFFPPFPEICQDLFQEFWTSMMISALNIRFLTSITHNRWMPVY